MIMVWWCKTSLSPFPLTLTKSLHLKGQCWSLISITKKSSPCSWRYVKKAISCPLHNFFLSCQILTYILVRRFPCPQSYISGRNSWITWFGNILFDRSFLHQGYKDEFELSRRKLTTTWRRKEKRRRKLNL